MIRDLVRDPICVVTRGSSYENRTNLAPAFLDQIIRKYEGTRLGRQELEAELLEDTPGALWSHGSIEASRLRVAPEMTRVVVAIDPAVTSGEEADETGIVVAGKGQNGHGYVLADISGRYPPLEWARLAIAAYRTHRAVGCRRCERVAEPKARIRSPPAVSQQTFGSSQDDARCSTRCHRIHPDTAFA